MSNGKKSAGGPIAIVLGLGCLGLLVVGVIVVAVLIMKAKKVVEDFADDPAGTVAEMIVKRDPNYEFISSDKKKRTITYREKKTGKTTTISWDNMEEGKFTVTSGDDKTSVNIGEGKATVETPEGTTTLGVGGGLEKFPKWFELPPGTGGWRTGVRQDKDNGQFTGSMVGESAQPVAELAEAFRKNVTAAGFTEKRSTDSASHAVLYFEDEGGKRTVSVTLFAQEGKTGVSVGYEQK